MLAKAHERKALISCSIRVGEQNRKRLFEFGLEGFSVVLGSQPAEGQAVESVLSCGLVRGHAYGITAVKKMRLLQSGGMDRLFMMRMRNPWGTTDWTGAWSQG